MDADLDTLCTVIYCTADDLLPSPRTQRAAPDHRRRAGHALRRPGDHGHPLRPQVPGAGAQAPRSPVPGPARPERLPQAPAQAGRRDRVAHGRVRRQSPGFSDDLLLVDSTPVPCAAEPRDGQAFGARRRRRLRLLRRPLALLLGLAPAPAGRASTAPRGRLRSPIPLAASARSALELLARCRAQAARSSSATRAMPAASSPQRAAELGVHGRAPEAQRTSPERVRTSRRSASASSSIFWTCKDLLTLERHGARTLAGLRERVLARFLCLAACISLNHQLGTAEPGTRRLLRLRLRAWNQSSSPSPHEYCPSSRCGRLVAAKRHPPSRHDLIPEADRVGPSLWTACGASDQGTGRRPSLTLYTAGTHPP